VEKFDLLLRKVEGAVVVVLTSLMLVLGFLQVFSRYVIESPIPWSEALLTYMFVWFSFIGTSLAVAEGAHFCVEIVFVRFPPRLRHYVELLIYVIIMFVAGLMIHKGALFVWVNRTQLMTILPFSMSWPYLALPVSGSLILIHSLSHFLRTLKRGGELRCQCSSS